MVGVGCCGCCPRRESWGRGGGPCKPGGEGARRGSSSEGSISTGVVALLLLLLLLLRLAETPPPPPTPPSPSTGVTDRENPAPPAVDDAPDGPPDSSVLAAEAARDGPPAACECGSACCCRPPSFTRRGRSSGGAGRTWSSAKWPPKALDGLWARNFSMESVRWRRGRTSVSTGSGGGRETGAGIAALGSGSLGGNTRRSVHTAAFQGSVGFAVTNMASWAIKKSAESPPTGTGATREQPGAAWKTPMGSA